jgi:hypothetical protein
VEDAGSSLHVQNVLHKVKVNQYIGRGRRLTAQSFGCVGRANHESGSNQSRESTWIFFQCLNDGALNFSQPSYKALLVLAR